MLLIKKFSKEAGQLETQSWKSIWKTKKNLACWLAVWQTLKFHEFKKKKEKEN